MPYQSRINSKEIIARDDIKLISENEDLIPVKFWEEKQKEIVTSVVDYNLESLDNLIRKGQIDLKPKYQRRHRWENTRKSKLIESFFMNVPIPPVFLNEDSYGKYSVIDGKQRLTAISDFLNDRFEISGLKVFEELNGKKFSDMQEELKAVIATRPTLRAVIILRQSDPDIKIEVFERLNTGGIKLNAQEIRNSTFTGSFNDLILELSESKRFHDLLRIKNKNKSSIFREMKDAELVLRYFTFSETWTTFGGGIAMSMSKYMGDNRHLGVETISGLRNKFIETEMKVDAAFGEYAFRRWNPVSAKWRAPVLAALYDAQMISVEQFSLSDLEYNSSRIIQGMQSLFEDVEFLKKVDAAIPSYFRDRIEAVTQMIAKAIE